jgi:hypothetical protein
LLRIVRQTTREVVENLNLIHSNDNSNDSNNSNDKVKPWTNEELKKRLGMYQSFEDIEKEKENKKSMIEI